MQRHPSCKIIFQPNNDSLLLLQHWIDVCCQLEKYCLVVSYIHPQSNQQMRKQCNSKILSQYSSCSLLLHLSEVNSYLFVASWKSIGSCSPIFIYWDRMQLWKVAFQPSNDPFVRFQTHEKTVVSETILYQLEQQFSKIHNLLFNLRVHHCSVWLWNTELIQLLPFIPLQQIVERQNLPNSWLCCVF